MELGSLLFLVFFVNVRNTHKKMFAIDVTPCPLAPFIKPSQVLCCCFVFFVVCSLFLGATRVLNIALFFFFFNEANNTS